MSLSPTPDQQSQRSSYELGWVAIHRMLREGGSWSGREQNCAFLNTRDGRFVTASGVTGLDVPDDMRAVARVDWDQDGRGDLLFTGRNSPRVRLFLNRAETAGKALEFRVQGTACNRDGVGARLELELDDGRKLVQSLRAGEGYLAQSSKWVHFGLGTAKPVKLRVRWPKPSERGWEEFQLAGETRRFTLVEGTGVAQPGASKPVDLDVRRAQELESNETARIPLAARVPLPPLPMVTPDGMTADAKLGVEPPLVVTLWASWCAPCVKELTEMARRADELRAAGINVLALSVDELATRKDALQLLERLQWDFHAGFATVDALEGLDALQASVLDRRRRTPVPTSFLVDGERRVAVIYKGPVELDTLLADVARLGARPEELRDRAAAFPGRWVGPLPEAPLAALELAYVERGLSAAADEIARDRMVSKKSSRAEILNEMGKVRAQQGRLDEAIASFAEALDLEPRSLELNINLAYALHQTGRVSDAVPFYENALRLDSRNVVALTNLALAHCALGRCDLADQELAVLEIVDPKAAADVRRQMKAYFGR